MKFVNTLCGQIIGKPHFAKELYEKGCISCTSDAYDMYFNKPPFNEIKREALLPEEAILLIKRFSGIAILAHPQTLKLDFNEFKIKVKELKKLGLDGLECYHSKQTREEMKFYKDIAIKNNLLFTCGSDFHGINVKPDTEMGSGINNNIINDNGKIILASLKARIK